MNMSKCNLCQNESFKTTKWNMIKYGKKLVELPAPHIIRNLIQKVYGLEVDILSFC